MSRKEPLHSYVPIGVAQSGLRQAQGFNGFAVAAMALAVVPLYLTSILAIIFGVLALGRINESEERGKRLAILAIIVAIVLPIVTTATVSNAYNAYKVKMGPTNTSLEQTYSDVVTNVKAIQAAIRAQPATDARTVPLTTHANEKIEVTYVDANTFTVRGYSTLVGNPDRDYFEWLSWATNGYDFHGVYQNYASSLCGCSNGGLQ